MVEERWPRWLRWVQVAGWGTVVLLWLLHVAGRPVPLGGARVVAVLVLLASGIAAGHGLVRRVRSVAAGDPWALAMPLVLGAALVSSFAGLDHEIADRTWLDEGTYARHASEINAGVWVRDSFVYPHLLYYAGAFAIWWASLFADLMSAVASRWLGIPDWATVCRLVLRVVVALGGALAVIPTARLARRLMAGSSLAPVAGVAAGLALAFCVPWIEGSHLAICDIPSAVLAICCLAACARWLDASRPAVWIVAGVCSGLAAAAKYPAGLVAVAIVALALRDGLSRPRRGLAALVIAGFASLGAFLITNPSLLVIPEMAWRGDRGILFGVVQYAGEGWLGVVPESRLGYYGALAREGFGWAAMMLGLVGLLVVGRQTRARVLWLLVFPLAYIALLATMTVAVERNLYPLLPAVAALVGVGVGSLIGRVPGRWFRASAVALPVIVLALPLSAAVDLAIGYTRENTRELARGWIERELTWGQRVLREDYTPTFAPERFETARLRGRFAAVLTPEELGRRRVDLVVLAEPTWGRFFGVDELGDADLALRQGYQRLFAELEPLARFEPSARRRGPRLDVLAVPATLALLEPRVELSAAAAFVPDGGMRAGDDVTFAAPGQWLAMSLALPAGTWRIRVDGEVDPSRARLELRTRDRKALAAADGLELVVTLEGPTATVLRLEAAVGARVRAVLVAQK